MMQIAVVYSLPTSRMCATPYGETDSDSAEIAEMVQKGLTARGMSTKIYAVTEDTIESIAEIKADVIFNLIEWCGRDIGLSQKAFAVMRSTEIPVTGSSEELFVLTGDKIRLKQMLKKIGAPCPEAAVFVTGDESIPKLEYPVIVKPSLEHCSTGLTYESIAHEESELRRIVKKQIASFNQGVLAEEFIVGRELLVYLLEDKSRVTVLPIEEMIFSSNAPLHFQTYDTKWNESSDDYQTTDVVIAKLSEEELRKIESECIRVFKQLGLRGYARFDLRLRDGIPYMLETNANPSVYDASEEIANIEDEVIWGIKFPDYLKAIVESAIWHYRKGHRV